MPFKSEKQRRFMWKNHPEIAERWSKEGKNKGLPMKKKKKKKESIKRFMKRRGVAK